MISLDAYVPWIPSEGDDDYPHPAPVCEPVNLAATTLPPLCYTLKNAECAGLSTLQRETIRRMMQSFEARKTFLLGDATGVGKGRTIAGLIAELAAAEGDVRVAWVSANMRLEEDARRELEAVGAAALLDSDTGGARFSSYAALQVAARASDFVEWLAQVERPVVVLDECHALRNSGGIVSQNIQNLINRTRGARSELRILYSSATACSTARHCEYLGSLGLFGTPESPFSDFSALQSALKRHGASLMELMAIDLRARGAYIARQLSFLDLRVEHRMVHLSDEQKRVYNACGASLRAAELLSGSTQQSFFQRLITALKVEETIRIVEEHVARGASVVVSLVNTGEATSRRMSNSNNNHNDHHRAIERHLVGAEALETHDAEPVDGLPENPLDRLIAHFGEARIAELTGRRLRVERGESNASGRRVKTPSIHDEVAAFQRGEKHVAVLSRAGGVGISLHDSIDGRPRVHVILEMPWSAEDLLQQMGRTHRSSSRRPPTYILVTSDLPAELRFASSIVAKLQNFGAMVKADRSSCCFSFFKVPRWSAAERRSIGLYLAMASARRPDDLPLMRLSRQQALLACQLDAGAGDAAMKTRVISLLQHSAELGDRRPAVMAAAQRLWPQDLTMLTERWTREGHSKFPSAFREQVMTLLLCAQAWETRDTLGLLDQDTLLRIVELIACPVTLDRAQVVATRFRQHGLEDMTAVPIDGVLNRMLGMEFEVQADVLAIADSVVQPTRPPPSACLLRYAMDRAGGAIQAWIDDVSHVSFGAPTVGVRVSIGYEVLQPEEPEKEANIVFWCHAKSGRVCWADPDRERLVFADRHTVRATNLADAAGMRARGYYRVSRLAWRRATAHHDHTASRRVRKLSKHFYIATEHAMRTWDASAHRILRVPPTTAFPNGVIGLLMHATG